MNSKIKKISDTQIEIEIEVPADKLSFYEQEALSELGKELEIQGFRKGKAPKNLVEAHIGKQNILSHAAEHAIDDFYNKALKEQNIEPIDRPEAEIIKMAPGNPLIFKVTVAILPDIDLPDYRKIASGVEWQKVLVNDADIKEAMDWLQKSRAKYSLKEGAAEAGDFIEIEYFSPDMEELAKQNASVYSREKKHKDGFILGEGHFVQGFEDNIFGMKGGEEKEFLVLMPEGFSPDKDKKELKFNVKVIGVQKRELPKFTDEFVKSLGDFSSVDELKKNISEGIQLEKELDEKQKVRNKILENISKEFDFQIPDALLQREKEKALNSIKHEVSHKFNIPFEKYLEKINKTEEDLVKSLEKETKENVKRMLIIREIGKRENIEVSDAEADEETNKILKKYEGIENAKKEVDISRLRDYNKEALKNEKIFQLLESLTKK